MKRKENKWKTQFIIAIFLLFITPLLVFAAYQVTKYLSRASELKNTNINFLQMQSSLSQSKLGPFLLVSYSNGARKIIESGPRIIKVLDPHLVSSHLEAASFYKSNFPNGTVVLRIWTGTSGLKYSLSNDPISSAEDFFQRVNEPALKSLGGNVSIFDYLASPNEFETTPQWWGKEKTEWNGKFWKRLTELNKSYNIKTCVGSIPVGNTSGTDLQYIASDLRAMKNMGAAFCYHGYTFNYSKDVNHEINYSLRYRQYYDYFRNSAPDLLSMPLILGEGGVAENGDPMGGYLRSGNSEKYKDWLLWFDSELKKDAYVLGVTLFQIGNESDWKDFSLEPISDWLANNLKSQGGYWEIQLTPTPTPLFPSATNRPTNPPAEQPTNPPNLPTLTPLLTQPPGFPSPTASHQDPNIPSATPIPTSQPTSNVTFPKNAVPTNIISPTPALLFPKIIDTVSQIKKIWDNFLPKLIHFSKTILP